MFQLSRDIPFCYGHRLRNYSGKCRHLHGHNGIARIVIEGDQLDASGMLLDISEIKELVQTWVDDNLDHTMILCRQDPLVQVLMEQGERVFVMDDNPTAENLAKLIYIHAKTAGLPVTEVIFWETEKNQAAYRESKGETSRPT